MEPLRGFSKIAWAAKLLPTTVLAYSVDGVDFCYLLKIQDYCLCPNGRYYNPPLAAHPPPLPTPLYTPLMILQ